MPSDVITIKVSGMDELLKRMDRLPEDIDAALEKTAWEWGTFWYNSTQEACPVDQGILAESGEFTVKEGTSGPVAVVTYKAPYAKPVEYGWRRDQPIEPVRKKAISYEADRVQRLEAGRSRGQANRVTVRRVIRPASFKGISFVRVPLQRARPYLKDFFHQAWTEQKEAA